MTKDLVARVLAAKGPCIATPGGANLRSYLARTILSTRPHHRYCVLEVATYRPGVMAPHVALIRPHIAVVTNVGRDHWRAFGSAEAIAREKGTLVAALPEDGIAILNADDPLVAGMAHTYGRRALTYGASPLADIRVIEARSAWPAPLTMTVAHGDRVVQVRSQLFGMHWQGAVLAALATGVAAGVDLAEAARAVEDVPPTPGRMSVEAHPDGVTFVRDDVKMSPPSVTAALEFLKNAEAPRKIIVLGTLADVPSGQWKRAYDRLARAALEVADIVIVVGPHASMALRVLAPEGAGRLLAFASVREASRYLEGILRSGDLVLLKGNIVTDHLMRIALARRQTVTCWDDGCGRMTHCTACERLSAAPSQARDSGRADTPPPANPMPAADGHDAVPVVVGLGNPGERYAGTPHNIGHDVLDALANRMGAVWTACPDGHVANVAHDNRPFLLVKLRTPVNRSGDGLRRWLDATGRSVSDCVLVYDDMALPRGTVRVRQRGSAGGHRGVASILTEFQTVDIPRVKIGVGNRDGTKLTAAQLLSPFPASEAPLMAEAVRTAIEEKLLETVALQRVIPAWANGPTSGQLRAGA